MANPANPMILSPGFALTPRRSRPVSASFLPVSGRWVTIDSSGNVITAVAATGVNAYLVLEGLQKSSETAAYTAGGTGSAFNIPSALVSLPSAVAANEVALAFGVYVYQVDQIGYAVNVASASPGALLYVLNDAAIPGGAVLSTTQTGSALPVAVLEKVSGTIITVRTLANG